MLGTKQKSMARVVRSLEQTLPRASLERFVGELPRNAHLIDIQQLSCVVVGRNGQHRILPAECLEPPSWQTIAPFHCLPNPGYIDFELALFAPTYGKHKAAEQMRTERARNDRGMQEIRVVRDEDLCLSVSGSQEAVLEGEAMLRCAR